MVSLINHTGCTAVSNGMDGACGGSPGEPQVAKGEGGAELVRWLEVGGRCILIDCVKQMPLPPLASLASSLACVARWLVDRTDVTLYDLFSPAPCSPLTSQPPSLNADDDLDSVLLPYLTKVWIWDTSAPIAVLCENPPFPFVKAASS